ncbi:MAG: DnaB-like helicase C-terminal domain-containing protein [Planctomycetota bacterium]
MDAIDFETGVIGSLLLDPDQVDLIPKICGQDFVDERLGEFFDLLVDLHEFGKPINDIRLVINQIKKRGLQIASATVAETFTSVALPHHAPYYAEKVAESSRLGRLANLQQELLDLINLPSADSTEIINLIQKRLNSIEQKSTIDIVNANDAAEEFLQHGQDCSSCVAMSGFPRIDESFGGFTAGELIVIGARLGTGKTAIGWQILEHGATRNRQGLFISLEMEPRQLIERHLASKTGVSAIRIRTRDFQESQTDQIQNELERFKSLPISIFAPSKADVRQIAAACRLKNRGCGLDLVVVDYMQLIRPQTRGKDRRFELEEISRDLKALARELEIPVIVLCQLNRAADGTIPRVAHIAECDTIGRDADQVWLIHRTKEGTDLRIAKHRYVADDAAIKLRYDNGQFYEESIGQPWQP